MKNFYRLFLIPCLMILFIALFTGFSSSKGQSEDPLEKLLNKRTSIIQNALYGYIPKEDAEVMLRDVAVPPLLKKDIMSLHNWDATQIDIIKDINVLNKTMTARIYDYITYNVTIRWDMVGAEGEYTQTDEYYVVLKKIGKEYKISEFTPTN